MFYGLHTTKKSERDLLLEREGELIEINPQDLHRSTLNKAIVIEEGEGNTYEHDINDFLELCKNLSNDKGYDPLGSSYYQRYSYKASDVYTRVLRLRGLIADIKENGIQQPVHVERTGERLDGSYRTKIALFLGIPRIKAILHAFKWEDIDEDFIERKLKARWLSSGKDYYEFEYGHKDWKNIPDGGPVYQENAERWKTIVPLIKGNTVLDLGCNEGYIAIQAARAGKRVIGVDIDWNHIAWLNKLIFEWVDKKEIPVDFIEGDISDPRFYWEHLHQHMASVDTVLMLNVLYHLPRDKQELLLNKLRGKQVIFQCNLRKEKERETYWGSHPDDLKTILKENGFKVIAEISFNDKPIIIAE